MTGFFYTQNLVYCCVNCYDYGARFYDASLGRWHVKDPLCEYHYNMTPYHYVLNDPMNYIDPLGLKERKWWQFWKPKEKPIPETDVVIDEVTVTAKDLSQKTNESSGYPNYLHNMLYWQPGGIEMTGGSGWSSYYSKNSEYIGDVGEITALVGGAAAGPFSKPDSPLLEILLRLNGIVGEVKGMSDKDIIQNSTGTGAKTDANGKPISNLPEGTRVAKKTERLNGCNLAKVDTAIKGDTIIPAKCLSHTGDSIPY